MRALRIAALVAAICVIGAAARAQTPEAGELYRNGDYEAAIRAGEMRGDAGGLEPAALAALADATTHERRCADCYRRADALARRAIAANPKRPRPYVYLVVALSHEIRMAGLTASLRAHYPQDAERAIKTAAPL